MSQDCNLATVARAVTLSQTRAHTHTHTFVRQDVSVILAPPVCSACPSFMTNSFCLPALLPLRLPTTCRNTFSIPITSFPHPAHLTPYFSPICTPVPPRHCQAFSHDRRPLTIHLLIICQDAALCCHWLVSPSPFYTFFSCHRPPPLWASSPSFLTSLFIAPVGACALIPCLFSLSHLWNPLALQFSLNVLKVSNLLAVLVGKVAVVRLSVPSE